MKAITLFVDSKKFTFLLFSALFFVGLGYILLLPAFEGFDESAHYSRIREIQNSDLSIFNKENYIDQLIVEYNGPMSYTSGSPPFSQENTYDNFFTKKNLVDGYIAKYRESSIERKFQSSNEINWEIQHPPLYYLLFSKVGLFFDKLPLLSQILFLRVTSYLLSLVGVFLGFMAISNMKKYVSNIKITNMKRGFLIYPLIFPMFFLEFSRIGNDSLCIFLVGTLFFLMTRWEVNNSCKIKSSLIGIILSLGVITKALFIPIIASVGFFILLNLRTQNTHIKALNLYKNSFFVFLPIISIGGGWYLFKYLMVGDPGFGAEAFQLSKQGGLINGLKEHFDMFVFARGFIVPSVTFLWAGTWSLVRMPFVSYIPLFIGGAMILKACISLSKEHKLDNITIFSISSFLLMCLGLAWHVIINGAMNGIATSPGWYLHILMPLMAPIVGSAYFKIIENRFNSKLFFSLEIYAFLFQIAAILCHAALFSGFASKGQDKFFVFDKNLFSLNGLLEAYQNLVILSFPTLSLLSFFLGFLILGFMILKTSLPK